MVASRNRRLVRLSLLNIRNCRRQNTASHTTATSWRWRDVTYASCVIHDFDQLVQQTFDKNQPRSMNATRLFQYLITRITKADFNRSTVKKKIRKPKRDARQKSTTTLFESKAIFNTYIHTKVGKKPNFCYWFICNILRA